MRSLKYIADSTATYLLAPRVKPLPSLFPVLFLTSDPARLIVLETQHWDEHNGVSAPEE